MLVASKYWSLARQHLSLWCSPPSRKETSLRAFRSRSPHPVASRYDNRNWLDFPPRNQSKDSIENPGSAHIIMALRFHRNRQGKTLFSFHLHCESSVAQSVHHLRHWGKISDVNGLALPRGKEVCNLIFKVLILWLWNLKRKKCFSPEREGEILVWAVHWELNDWPGSGPGKSWSRLTTVVHLCPVSGESLCPSASALQLWGRERRRLVRESGSENLASLPRTNGRSSACMKNTLCSGPENRKEASTDLSWHQSIVVCKDLDVLILLSAELRKKKTAKVQWDSSQVTQKEFELR